MYADFSRDQVNAFLQDLTDQPQTGAIDGVAEDFSDEMFLAQMELSRFKATKLRGEQFVPRRDAFRGRARIHPADLH